MLIICPNLSNKEVAAEFNELVEATSEKAAYAIWSQNNGNAIDKAPNGEPSKLFSDLLSHYNGDRRLAIQAKAKVFSESFKTWFGDWLHMYDLDELKHEFKDLYRQSDKLYSVLVTEVIDSGLIASEDVKIISHELGRGSHYLTEGKLVLASDGMGISKNYINAHELLHAASSRILYAYEDHKGLLDEYMYPEKIREVLKKGKVVLSAEQIKACEILADIKEKAAQYIDLHPDLADTIEKKYPTGSINYFTLETNKFTLHEFVSEVLTNPQLMEILKNIPYQTSGKKQSLFLKFVEALSKLFNLDNNALGRFLEEVDILFTPQKSNVSKAVDENGEPLVVYHSTSVNKYGFDTIDFSKSDDGISFFASDNKFMSSSYGVGIHYNIPEARERANRYLWEADYDELDNLYEEGILNDFGGFYPTDPVIYHPAVNSHGEVFSSRNGRDTFFKKITSADIIALINGNLDIIGDILSDPNYDDGDKTLELQKRGFDFDKIDNTIQRLNDDLKYFKDNNVVITASSVDDVIENYQYNLFFNLKNPLVINNESAVSWKQIKYKGKLYNTRRINRLAKSEGYDGVMISNVIDYGNKIPNHMMYNSKPISGEDFYTYYDKQFKTGTVLSAFDENQIKSVDNRGTFSRQDNNIYYRGRSTTNNTRTVDHSNIVESARSSAELLDYIINLDGVSPVVKRIAEKLKQESISIEIRHTYDGNDAAYNGNVVLYKHVYSSRSNLEFAADVVHEMIHHYLQRKYDKDSTLRNLLDTHVKYYNNVIGKNNIYGLKNGKEFMSEIMSNDKFRKQLRFAGVSKWKLFVRKLAEYLGLNLFKEEYKKYKENSLDVSDVTAMLETLIDNVNAGIIKHYTTDDYILTQHKQNAKVDKSVDKIKKGIKQRLNSIKRYQTKNLEVIQTEQKLLDELDRVDSIEGVVDFVNYVSDSIDSAFDFLNNNPDEINSRQLVQLKRDYLSFFMPMMLDILFLIDTTTVLKDNITDYPEFVSQVSRIRSMQQSMMNKYDNILRSTFRNTVRQYAEEHGSQTVEQLLTWLDDPSKDLNWLEYFIGQSSAANNEIVRIMADILNGSINETKRNTYDEGVKLVKLYNAAKKAYSGDVMSLLQEKDDNGNTTGYFVRALNYGKFYADQQKAVDKIVSDMGITRDENGMLQFESKEQEKEYRWRKIQWQLKHGELKYTKDYYDLKFSLSVEAQDALDEVDNLVSDIMQKTREKGVLRLDKLTDQDKRNLDALARQKAELYSEYYSDGTAKAGIELKIAKELLEFRKKLNKNIRYRKDFNLFNRTAKSIIAKYGVNSKEYTKWFAASTEEVFTDEFYDELESRITPNPVTEEWREERSRLLAMYRNKGTREITMEIPDNIKKRIKELDKLIAENTPPRIDNSASVSGIASFTKSKKYYEDAQAARQEGRYEQWYAESHYEDNKGRLRTVSYYTYMVPNDSKYKQIQPNAYFSMVDQSAPFVNKNYDLNGEYVLPKKSLYDNSKQFKEILKNPEVKALYDALIQTMSNSYEKVSFMERVNPYKLPQISGRMMSIISRSDDKFEAMKYIVKDALVVKDDDTDYVEKYDQRNDGSQVKLIPTRFIKILDDPSKITSDVVGSVIQFFEMAENYRNMSNVQDDLEMMLYGIGDLSINKSKKVISGKESNVYKKASDLLDMVLYGEKKRQLTVGGLNITKGLQKVYSYISLTNLANNLWAITANYATGLVNTDIEAVAGKYFDASDMHFAKKELLYRLPDITAHISDVNHKDKLLMMMQKNQVTRSNQETFDRLDQSRILRGLNQHFWYNGYTAGDFAIKSLLLMAVYHGYKHIDGEYLTKNQFISKYYANDKHAGERAFKAISDTLWDAFDVVNGELKNVAKNALKLAADKAAEQAQKKVNALAVRIDGNITDVDRAAVHRNVLTQFLVMHRNFMINGLQERFKAKQYNYSTGEMEGGMYADAAKFIWHSLRDGKIKFITQAMAEWQNLDELERYNVRKVFIDLVNMAIWGTLASLVLCAAADDDDEKDNWALQAAAYSATRISFEFRTMYNPLELMNLLNSPSAAINHVENASSFVKLLWIPNYFTEKKPWGEVKSGTYKGWPKPLRNFIKITPIKNIYEATSVEGIRGKRNYLENQLAF